MSKKNIISIQETEKEKVALREKINLDKLTLEQRYEYAKNLIVWHPKMKLLYQEINKVHANLTSSEEPECMSLFGPTRVGKSTIVKQYLKKHPRFETEDKVFSIYTRTYSNATITKIPVLYVKQIDVPASIGSIINSMLQSLGHPFSCSGTRLYQETSRLKQLLVNCGVELIILDEVQHFIDRNKKRLLSDSADWLKGLIIDTNIPVVLMGTLESEKIFVNDQLQGRFRNNHRLFPFNCHSENERIQFRKLLQTIDNGLPLKEKSNLSHTGTWELIYLGTDGKVAFVMDFVRRCVEQALQTKMEFLDHKIMFNTYQKYYSRLALCESNPFEPKFDTDKYFDLDFHRKNSDYTYGVKTNNRSNLHQNMFSD